MLWHKQNWCTVAYYLLSIASYYSNKWCTSLLKKGAYEKIKERERHREREGGEREREREPKLIWYSSCFNDTLT